MGYCGWPTSCYFSEKGHDVLVIDNFSTSFKNSLIKINQPEERVQNFQNMEFTNLDAAEDANELMRAIKLFNPDVIIDFARQRSAPLSMLDFNTQEATLRNNALVTNNVCISIKALNISPHIIHLGTMGVFGYEGEKDFDEKDFSLNGKNAGSIYHLTKLQNQITYQYFSHYYGLNVSILNQGVVWGVHYNEKVENRYDYSGELGTVINRFLVQSLARIPLTIYGSGSQQRGFININDMVRCIDYVFKNRGRGLNYYNQITERMTVNEIVEKMKPVIDIEVEYLDNPRVEAEENSFRYDSIFKGVISDPVLFKSLDIKKNLEILKKHMSNLNPLLIESKARW